MRYITALLALTLTAHEMSFADGTDLPPEEVIVIYQEGFEQTINSTQFNKELLRPHVRNEPMRTVLDITLICYSDRYWELSVTHNSGERLEDYLKEETLNQVFTLVLESAEDTCMDEWDKKYGAAYRQSIKPTWYL